MKSALRRAAERYRAWPRFYYYARCKLRLDPAYPAIVALLRESDLPVLDLGSGMGLLGVCLREAGYHSALAGVDVDAEKVALTHLVLGADGAGYEAGDARNFPAHYGNVVVFDLLHYFSDEEQTVFLHQVAASIAPGGMAVIRSALEEPGWRFRATKLGEWFIRASGWIAFNGWNFPTEEKITGPFREKGFAIERRPLFGLTPFNNYLFVFRRAESDV